MIYNYNKDIIDSICDIAPAVKPQMAFYEKYGSQGVIAFERTVMYAKAKGLIVVEDAKRNDIGNTAQAYADGHLGKVEMLDGSFISSFDVDFLTVSPYLGSESLMPFMNECVINGKGIFVLVKTSNPSSGEIQDVVSSNGKSISENIADNIFSNAKKCIGEKGYSSIGAVVGATYPEDAIKLRKIMPSSIFLVPGYGAQGACIKDIMPCFNPDGLGAIVNSSRGILYSYLSNGFDVYCSKQEYLSSVVNETLKMQKEIYSELKTIFPNIVY